VKGHFGDFIVISIKSHIKTTPMVCQTPYIKKKKMLNAHVYPYFFKNWTLRRFTVYFISISQPQLVQKIDFKKKTLFYP